MSTVVRRALYGKLAGDVTLQNQLGTPASGYSQNIYAGVAPAGAGFPFVVLSKQSGRPTEAFGVPSAIETDVWLVKCVDRDTSADGAEAVAARLVVLLNDAALSITGATLLYLRRQSDVQYPETLDGVLYQHVGSLFRLVTT